MELIKTQIHKVTKKLIKSIEPQFNAIKEKYVFDFGLFKIARENIGIKPCGVPLFMSYLFEKNMIPTCDEMEKSARNHPLFKISGHERFGFSVDQVVKARLWQFWTGCLREVHVMINIHNLDPNGTLEKDFDKDLQKNATDLLYTRSIDGKTYSIGIGHQGEYSDRYMSMRKKDKQVNGLIFLEAPNKRSDNGLHVVPIEIIQSIVFEKKSMSVNNISYAQKIIDMWIESKDQLQRKDVIERLIHLYEANKIENEINKDSVDLTEKINNIDDGNKTTKTNHQIICGNILDDNTIKKINTPHCNLVVCSPPYNKNEEYITYKDNLPFNEYLSFLQNFIKQCDKILVPGARFVINIRDIAVSSGVRFPILAALYSIFNQLKYTYRGTHIWYKGREESSTGWGSFCSSANPSVIDLFEYVFVFQKDGQYLTGKDNLDKTDFIESVIGLWKIRPVKKIFGKKKINQIKHPCPYPVELAKRAIKLYSHVGDTVLDPFAGVLSTSIAAGQSGRNSIAIDIEDAYLKAGIERFKNELDITEYTESTSPVKIEYCSN